MFKKTKNELQSNQALLHALTSESIDYFYQLKEAGELTIELLDMSLHFCGNHHLSWSFTQKIIALGANNFRSVLINALCQQNYTLASHLFEIQPHINPLETQHYSHHSLVYIKDLIDKINSTHMAHLFACIVRSLPNHTQMVSRSKHTVYCRGMNEDALHDYNYIYNELLGQCLRRTYQSNTNTDNIELAIIMAIEALAQRSFSLSQENKDMLLDIRDIHFEIYTLFSRRMTNSTGDNNFHDEFIEDIDEEFYSTDMAQRKLGIYQFWDNGHEIKRQKFRVYLGLARHLNAPHSLNQSIWEALCQSWIYKARNPTIEEYHFLKTLKHSTANHQTLLNFFNRYIHFEPIYQNDLLAQKLDNSLAIHTSQAEDELGKI
jgi:hypothetical protein